MKVIEFPLAKITFCFVFGILAAKYLHISLHWFWIFITLLFYAITAFFYFKKINNLFVVSSLLVSFLTGIITLLSHSELYNPSHYVHVINDCDKEISTEVILTEKLKSTHNNSRYTARVNFINNKKSFGKLIVNIVRDSSLQHLEIGSHLLVRGSYYRNKKPLNPNEFDYGNYLENKQIFAQVYTNYQNIKITSIEKSIWYYTSKLRNTIAKNLEKNGFSKQELNVVMALILGQQQDISQDVIRDYQYAGAIHILSVSGLHVASILLVLNFLLNFFPNTKKWRFFKLLFLLTFLWVFAALAGLAPAVLRSVTMYSFVIVGLHLRKTVNIYHTLLVSMLIILVVEPSFLFDVGFQLSYVALFFIVWLQPLLQGIYTPKNKIQNYLWNIVTVSFAAQIGTLPLSLYYFHQFPMLFFVTNLVVLPALGIIMGYGVFIMLLAIFNICTYWLLKPLEWSIWLMNKVINWVASFENFVLKDISFTAPMMWLFYGLIILFFISVEKPTFKKIIATLCCIIALQAVFIFEKYKVQKTNELIVFNKNRNTAITIRNGSKLILYANDSIEKNYKTDWSLKSYSVANFCEVKRVRTIQNFMYFKYKKIVIVDSTSLYLQKMQADIL